MLQLFFLSCGVCNMLDFISTGNHGKPEYDGLLVTAEFREQHTKLIQKFISGRVKLDAKKGTPHCLLTTKTSKGDRAMFAPVQVEHQGVIYNCLAFLEDIGPQHRYQNSNYLNNPHAFLNFRNALSERTNIASFNVPIAMTEVEPDNAEDETLSPAYVFNKNYVVLSDTQTQIFDNPLPLIVSGSAGAGKSLTALLKLASFLEQFNDETPKRLLFTADSKQLVEQMQKNWLHLPLLERPANIEVEFCTHDELLKKARPELANATRVNADREKSHFKDWLAEDYAISQKKAAPAQPKPKNKRRKPTKGKQKKPVQSPFEIILANPDKLYQEFRIISGCKNNIEVYFELGTKQSLFQDKTQRELCFQAYQAYLKSLEGNNQYDTSFTPFKLAEEVKYDGCVCDEWLDCSPLQTQLLFESTRNAQVLFCGDVNQTLTDTIPSYAFLERLCYENKVALSELDLPGSYRCPPSVIGFAKVVLDVKHSLVGSAVKKEQGKSNLTERSETSTGNIVWLNKISAEEESKFNELSKSTDFVIITLPEHIEDARKQFPNATIFTPAEIKGLEYRAVMLYRIFEDPICIAANREFSPKNISDTPIHRPKVSDVDPTYHPFFNSIYTAMTRTIESLYVYQPLHHPTSKITDFIKDQLKTGAPGQIQTENFTPATREQYITEVLRLWKNGNTDQAQQIINREELVDEPQIRAVIKSNRRTNRTESHRISPSNTTLNPVEEPTEPKVITLRPATPQEQKQFDALCKSKNLKEFKKELNKVQDLGVFFNEIIFKITTQKSYFHNLLTLIFTSENGTFKTAGVNILRNYFLIVIEDPQIALKIFSASFFSPISAVKQIFKNFVTAIMLLGDKKLAPLVINVIKQHLHNKTPTLRCILDNLFLVLEISSKKHMLFFGLNNETGTFDTDLFASLILEKYRFLSDEQMVEQFFLPNELSDNSSPFFMLTAHKDFLDVLKKLFEKRPGLYKFISIAHLFKQMPKPNLPSVFSNLVSSDNGTQTPKNFAFLLELFDKNPSLAQDFTIDHLCNIPFFNGNLFYTLCRSADGIAFLQYLFDKNPNLLAKLPVSALFESENRICAYAILASSESGLKLIRNILKRNKKICQELTAEHLPQIQQVIPLLMQKLAYDIVEYILENNPKLVEKLNETEINYPALKAIIEKHLANALRNPTAQVKEYLDRFLSMRASEKSLSDFLKHKDAVDYLLNFRVNDSNALSEIAIKNPRNLQALLTVFKSDPQLLQKFSNPALFRVRGNQGGDFTRKSTLECLETQPAGKELIELIALLFEEPKVIQLRKATAPEQQQFDRLLLCKNYVELKTTLASISNISEFFNEIVFDFKLPQKPSDSLIVTLATYPSDDPRKFPRQIFFIKILYDLLKYDSYIRSSIFSAEFFSLFKTENNPIPQSTGALASMQTTLKHYIKIAIREHLANPTPALTCLLENFFIMNKTEDGNEYFLFSYLEDESGKLDVALIVELILEKYKGLSDEELWQQLCKPIAAAKNQNVLLILSRDQRPVAMLYGDEQYIAILQGFFDKRPELYNLITADILFQKQPLADGTSPSFLKNLIKIKGFTFLFKVFERNKNIVNEIDPEKFYSNPDEAIYSYFQRLCFCKTNEGLRFLNLLYEHNPTLLAQMKSEDLFTNPFHPDKHAFHFILLGGVQGILLIRKILTKHPDFCKHITLNSFLYERENVSNFFYDKIIRFKCYDIFELMFANNSDLAIEFSKQDDITDPKLKRIIQKYLPAAPSVATNPNGFHYHSETTVENPEESEQHETTITPNL